MLLVVGGGGLVVVQVFPSFFSFGVQVQCLLPAGFGCFFSFPGLEILKAAMSDGVSDSCKFSLSRVQIGVDL